jgi:FKBP-type peptidyl-prolyl cis-trans isomerase
MATPRSQRIGIWIITIVMAIGSIGVFFVAILANANDSDKNAKVQAAYIKYQQDVADQAKELSDKYYPTFSKYSSEVHSFEASDAQKGLVKKDLKVGDGATIDGSTAFAAYYIGWDPNGTIFDQSIENGALKTPFSISSGLDSTGVIDGWKEGLIGMKIGGVRELTIPSDKAYGETGSGSTIAPNTPLKFIIFAIPVPEEVPVPTELLSS